MKSMMLYSGGADSLALWYLTGKPVGIYVRIGAPYEEKELQAIERQKAVLPELTVLVVDGAKVGAREATDGRIPLRNSLLCQTACALYDMDRLIVGFLRGEASPDKSKKFLRRLNRLMRESEPTKTATVVAPAIGMTKTQLLRLLKDVYPDAPLALTVSCYAAEGEPCNDCPSCFRANVAKYRSGWSDVKPTLPSRRGSAWRAVEAAGVARLPALVRNNADAILALWGVR